jgi:hypothetical protein
MDSSKTLILLMGKKIENKARTRTEIETKVTVN